MIPTNALHRKTVPEFQLSALQKSNDMLTLEMWTIEGWISNYSKDTDHLYHAFMHSLVSLFFPVSMLPVSYST